VDFATDPAIQLLFEEKSAHTLQEFERSMASCGEKMQDFQENFLFEHMRKATSADEHKASSVLQQANIFAGQGSPQRAEGLFREGLGIRERLYGRDSSLALQAKEELGRFLGNQDRFDESETVFSECCATWSALLEMSHPNYALEHILSRATSTNPGDSFLLLSIAKMRVKKYPEAERASTKAIAFFRLSEIAKVTDKEFLDQMHALDSRRSKSLRSQNGLMHALGNHARVLGKCGKWAGADLALSEATEMGMPLVDVKRIMGGLRYDQGRLQEAVTLKREALAMDLKELGKNDFQILESYDAVMQIAIVLPHHHETIKLVRTAASLSNKIVGAEHIKTLTFLAVADHMKNKVEAGHKQCKERFPCSHRCAFCWVVAPVEKLEKCGKCAKARYCGVECQRGDWAQHKLKCGKE
jgi:tetratricopeptide (TPR) repeat protein